MNAGLKWLDLVLDILGKETDGGPLLSEGADRLIEKHPIAGRVLILCVGTIITLHLANVPPERWDILAIRFWKR